MKLITNSNDKAILETAKSKAQRLCKLYKCELIDLMVLSMKVNAEIKKAQNNNKI